MKKVIILLLAWWLTINLFGQENEFWNDVKESTIQTENVSSERWIIPQKYRTLQLDRAAFEAQLKQSPTQNNANGSSLIVSIPMPDGTIQQFAIVESSVMAPKLAARYPTIRTYSGRGIDDEMAKIYMDMTPAGFHAMILAPSGSVFIDPYFRNEDKYYVAYDRKNYAPDENRIWTCEVENEKGLAEDETHISDPAINLGQARFSSIQMRTYKIAIAANGEYTAYHGGTVAGALAAINTALNRVKGVYEDEIAVSFVLVDDNDDIIFTNAATDPYANSASDINANTAVLDNAIGNANYDVGHIFTTGSGGVASLGAICGANKARGTTGLSNPINDPFYIDYVAHEIGHQFGGNHTFNGDSGSCSGGNRNGGTAYEPGSGATIQAYAGICSNDNIQNNSDPYFHLVSLNEMRAHVTSGSGGTCGTTSLMNTTPIVRSNVDRISGKSIPLNTPFELTGEANDPDGDNLLYNWEEWDLGPQSDLNSPSGNAPLFRSFEPTTDLTRTFPRLSNLLNNTTPTGEVLPTYARSLSFQFIARDDAMAGGYGAGMVTLNAIAGTGPFQVNSPNGGGTLSGETTITWNVAGTTAAPISCAEVDIYLSTDGGLTFTQLLVDNTANDGSVTTILPDITTSTARIKVKCADNVFFDISNANFSVQPAANNNCDITNITAGVTSACNNTNNTYTQAITVTYNDAPSSGNLVVNNQAFPITNSPQTITLTGLSSNGGSVDVTAAFSDQFTCSFTKNNVYNAPQPCVGATCLEYTNNTPVTISSGAPPTVITSTLNISQIGSIQDVNVQNITGTHSYINDLIITLTSPEGTTISLFSKICGSQNNFNLGFDDASANTTFPCPPTGGAIYQSQGTLSDFNGQDPNGDWVLTIQDVFNQDGGQLSSWTLEVCTEVETLAGSDCDGTDLAYNQTSIPANTYKASNTITSTGTVAAGTTVNFVAATSITLGVNFHATATSTFSAKIGACSNSLQRTIPAQYSQQKPSIKPTKNLKDVANFLTAVAVHPNPFSHQTTITYELENNSPLEIGLFDLTGKKIKAIFSSSNQLAGFYQFPLAVNQFSVGMYLLRFQTVDGVIAKKVVIH